MIQAEMVKHALLVAMWEVCRTSEAHNRAQELYKRWQTDWTARVEAVRLNDPDAHSELVLRDEADMRAEEMGKTARPYIEAEAKYRALVDLIADLGFGTEAP